METSTMPSPVLRRVTTLEELEPLYQIAADAWQDDACFNWFYPGGQEHPSDFVTLWELLLQRDFFDPGKFIFAATVPAQGGTASSPTTEVVGFAVWERRGSSDAARSWQGTTVSEKLKRWRLTLKTTYTYVLGPEKRSISTKRVKELEKELDSIKAGQPSEAWYLRFLGVSPKAQRMGIGKLLLRWGIERSEEEGIPASLEASNAGLGLYQKMGFEETRRMYFDDKRQSQAVMERACRRG